jgi:anti-sigma factor RsiW
VRNCSEIRALIGTHLLGGLDDQEASALFAHLAECPECAAKHARLSQLVPLIDRAGPIDERPDLPEHAKERLLAGSAWAESPAPRWQSRPLAAFRRFAPVLGGSLAGAGATLAVVAAFGGLSGSSSPAQRAATSVRLSPTLEAPTAAATVYVINHQGAATIALEASGLPAPRPGERYIVWLSGDHGSYAVGEIQVSRTGWATAILRSPHTTWPGTRISILATPRMSMTGRTRMLVRGTL